MGWGPRKFGWDTLDIRLIEPLSPPIAFEVHPDPAGARLITKYSTLVLVNQMPAQSDILHERDLIQIGSTTIEVHYQ